MLSYLSILLFLFYVLVFVFIAYFFISIILFMKKKNQHDELLLQQMKEVSSKLNELIENKRN